MPLVAFSQDTEQQKVQARAGTVACCAFTLNLKCMNAPAMMTEPIGSFQEHVSLCSSAHVSSETIKSGIFRICKQTRK